ncbi:luciferin sulfotransferase-like [Pieris brassicae]|uniref:luciferin sulfotransferase-like n=1 Tax=Pieris brassicae TaxID=7116 RepID=UPI001E65EB3F|nr:luciferin sulfotransferase-like [Pieris brassicae]
MEIRPSDVFVVTYARSGTTWTQELVWLVANDLDYDTAKSVYLTERFPFLEFSMMVHPTMIQRYLENSHGDEKKQKEIKIITSHVVKQVEEAPSPRFIKTHLPLSLLSPKLLDAKVVYVARDPKDVAVSFYHLCSSMTFMGWTGDFKQFWELFISDLQYWSPFFEHLKEAWAMRHHPNLLFIFYEELQKDLPGVIKRVSAFMGKNYNDVEVATLCEHLNVKNFKKNPSINNEQFKELGLTTPDLEFIRKGKSGGWRDYFDEEMIARTDKWVEENLRDTDLRFPSAE